MITNSFHFIVWTSFVVLLLARKQFVFVVFFTMVLPSVAFADGVLRCSPTIAVANGEMKVYWREKPAPTVPTQLLVHFHGAHTTVQKAFIKSELDGVLAVVNFPGLSTAYSKPFQSNSELFTQILELAKRHVEELSGIANIRRWQHVCVSSFSAGYGATREILKTPTFFEQIDSIVAADSIYAGLNDESLHRQVNQEHMRDFLRFAKAAVKGQKIFVVTHSAQKTTYASTTETSSYLLSELHMPRAAETSPLIPEMKLASHSKRGRFAVLGFQGDSAQQHMQHLHNIDHFWKFAINLRHKTR